MNRDYSNVDYFDFVWFYERLDREKNKENSEQTNAGSVSIADMARMMTTGSER